VGNVDDFDSVHGAWISAAGAVIVSRALQGTVGCRTIAR
jgi:hypothetical protein